MQEMTANMYVISNLSFLNGDETIMSAYQKMKKNQIKHLPVIDNGEAIGIVSDRDLQFITSSGAPDRIKCRDIMTEDPMAVDTTAPIQDVAKMMVEKKINSVLINNNEGKVVGIFTSTDALKLIATYQS